jgi:hypothetical protein
MSKKELGTGHICFLGDTEYFEVNGRVWEAPLKNGLDPDGYRLGAKSYVYRDQTPKDFIKDIQEMLDEDLDGVLWEKNVHPEDHHVFTRPNPDPDYLALWKILKEIVPSYVGLNVRGQIIKITLPDVDKKKNTDQDRVDVIKARKIIEAIPHVTFDKLWGSFYWYILPWGQRKTAVEHLKKPSV